MSAPDLSKIQKFREHLQQEWTGDKTVAARRKWHAHAAAFTNCRLGIMFSPGVPKALRDCFRVLKPGGPAVFVAWGKKEQPFFTTTAGIIFKRLPLPPPPPIPDAPSLFMFGERERLRRALET